MTRLVAYVVLIMAALLIGPLLRLLYVYVPIPQEEVSAFAERLQDDKSAPSSPPPISWGREIYANSCMDCHGSGTKEFGFDQTYFYPLETSSPADVYKLISNGTGFSLRKSHPTYPAALIDIERWSVASYIYTAPANPMATGSVYDDLTKGPDPGELLYSQFCAGCHGIGGYGDGPLSGDFDRPPTILRDTAWLARQSDAHLVSVIVNGTNGGYGSPNENWSGMPSFSDFLKKDDIRNIVNYVRSFGYSIVSDRARPGSLYRQGQENSIPPDSNLWEWSEVTRALDEVPENPPDWMSESSNR